MGTQLLLVRLLMSWAVFAWQVWGSQFQICHISFEIPRSMQCDAQIQTVISWHMI